MCILIQYPLALCHFIAYCKCMVIKTDVALQPLEYDDLKSRLLLLHEKVESVAV